MHLAAKLKGKLKRSKMPTPPDPSHEMPAVVALRIASLFTFLEGKFTTVHAQGDDAREAVVALAHKWMVPTALEGIYRTAGPRDELDAMYAHLVNDVAESPAAAWSHDHAELSDDDAASSRCTAELAEVETLLRVASINVTSASFVHVVTGAIKRALRSYAPLLTFAAHDAWVAAATSGNESALSELKQSLPPTSAWLLSELLAHAKAVLAQEAANRMTSKALAITLFVNVLRVENAMAIPDSASGEAVLTALVSLGSHRHAPPPPITSHRRAPPPPKSMTAASDDEEEEEGEQQAEEVNEKESAAEEESAFTAMVADEAADEAATNAAPEALAAAEEGEAAEADASSAAEVGVEVEVEATAPAAAVGKEAEVEAEAEAAIEAAATPAEGEEATPVVDKSGNTSEESDAVAVEDLAEEDLEEMDVVVEDGDEAPAAAEGGDDGEHVEQGADATEVETPAADTETAESAAVDADAAVADADEAADTAEAADVAEVEAAAAAEAEEEAEAEAAAAAAAAEAEADEAAAALEIAEAQAAAAAALEAKATADAEAAAAAAADASAAAAAADAEAVRLEAAKKKAKEAAERMTIATLLRMLTWAHDARDAVSLAVDKRITSHENEMATLEYELDEMATLRKEWHAAAKMQSVRRGCLVRRVIKMAKLKARAAEMSMGTKWDAKSRKFYDSRMAWKDGAWHDQWTDKMVYEQEKWLLRARKAPVEAQDAAVVLASQSASPRHTRRDPNGGGGGSKFGGGGRRGAWLDAEEHRWQEVEVELKTPRHGAAGGFGAAARTKSGESGRRRSILIVEEDDHDEMDAAASADEAGLHENTRPPSSKMPHLDVQTSGLVVDKEHRRAKSAMHRTEKKKKTKKASHRRRRKNGEKKRHRRHRTRTVTPQKALDWLLRHITEDREFEMRTAVASDETLRSIAMKYLEHSHGRSRMRAGQLLQYFGIERELVQSAIVHNLLASFGCACAESLRYEDVLVGGASGGAEPVPSSPFRAIRPKDGGGDGGHLEDTSIDFVDFVIGLAALHGDGLMRRRLRAGFVLFDAHDDGALRGEQIYATMRSTVLAAARLHVEHDHEHSSAVNVTASRLGALVSKGKLTDLSRDPEAKIAIEELAMEAALHAAGEGGGGMGDDALRVRGFDSWLRNV